MEKNKKKKYLNFNKKILSFQKYLKEHHNPSDQEERDVLRETFADMIIELYEISNIELTKEELDDLLGENEDIYQVILRKKKIS